MDSSAYGHLPIMGIARVVIVGFLITVPLAIWKGIDLLILLFRHISVVWH